MSHSEAIPIIVGLINTDDDRYYAVIMVSSPDVIKDAKSHKDLVQGFCDYYYVNNNGHKPRLCVVCVKESSGYKVWPHFSPDIKIGPDRQWIYQDFRCQLDDYHNWSRLYFMYHPPAEENPKGVIEPVKSTETPKILGGIQRFFVACKDYCSTYPLPARYGPPVMPGSPMPPGLVGSPRIPGSPMPPGLVGSPRIPGSPIPSRVLQQLHLP